MNEQEREGQEIVIDLGAARRGELNEIFFRAFGWGVKKLLGMMFGGQAAIPVKIKGNREEISSFASAMGKEKRYMKSAAKYGLNNPKTYKDKYALRKAAAKFERKTGIKWPFKG
tara:strand:- start:240 stop:581 length:342 start_codon:yes stop_codon:yes gene_type:complete